MTDIAEFLLARIAEDAVAAEVHPMGVDGDRLSIRHGDQWVVIWDPARVLAECEAKRRLLELHDEQGGHCIMDGDGWPCTTLRILALPYAGHPDYDADWRP